MRPESTVQKTTEPLSLFGESIPDVLLPVFEQSSPDNPHFLGQVNRHWRGVYAIFNARYEDKFKNYFPLQYRELKSQQKTIINWHKKFKSEFSDAFLRGGIKVGMQDAFGNMVEKFPHAFFRSLHLAFAENKPAEVDRLIEDYKKDPGDETSPKIEELLEVIGTLVEFYDIFSLIRTDNLSEIREIIWAFIKEKIKNEALLPTWAMATYQPSELVMELFKQHEDLNLISPDEDVNLIFRFNERFGPLHFAVRQSYPDVVRYLVENGAPIDGDPHDDCTPLEEACGMGDIEIARFLLDNGASISNALEYACIYNWIEIVRLLLDRGANPDPISLLNAVHLGYLEIVDLLLDRGAQIDYILDDPFDNSRAMTLACSNGDRAMVNLLVKRGASVNAVENENEYKDPKAPLAVSCYHGFRKIAAFLLNKGADNSPQALLFATDEGHADIVELLLSRGAAVDGAVKNLFNNERPLVLACRNGDLDMVKLLVKHGARVDALASDDPNSNPLLISCQENLVEIAAFLLNYVECPPFIDPYQFSVEICSLLLEKAPRPIEIFPDFEEFSRSRDSDNSPEIEHPDTWEPTGKRYSFFRDAPEAENADPNDSNQHKKPRIDFQ